MWTEFMSRRYRRWQVK